MDRKLKRLLANWRKLTIHPTAEIHCQEIELGDGSIVGPGVVIEGTRVVIGREAWLDRYAYIGGGSAFDPSGELIAGDWLHMGRQSHINMARGVKVGHEFGCGIETKVFTHGAYLSEIDGFPVNFARSTIGNRVWLPNAWVNPGVNIGDNVVVAARSLVNRDVPSGCLAGGIPAKVLKERCYPRMLTQSERLEIARRILAETLEIAGGLFRGAAYIHFDGGRMVITCGINESFDLDLRRISGEVSDFGLALKNQLRRHGIRFRFEKREGRWAEWTVR